MGKKISKSGSRVVVKQFKGQTSRAQTLFRITKAYIGTKSRIDFENTNEYTDKRDMEP